MIKTSNGYNCCGCGACKSVCPKQCIEMLPGEYGFLYPVVDTSKCVNCHLCENVCLYINNNTDKCNNSIYKCFALKHKEKKIREKSASGGAFSVFAEYVIKEKRGGVYGASFDEKWAVKHTYINNIGDLDKLRGSKYLQSDIGDTYIDCKTRLDKGETILFSGTPCQISGLKLYLRKNYENLFTIAIICHSVSSPWIWNTYLEEISSKKNISCINFRCKKYSWDHYSFRIIDTSNRKIIDEISSFNSYTRCVMRGDFQRLSCENCYAKGERNMADIIIGDFWGIWQINNRFYDKRGVSAVIMYNDRLSGALGDAQIQEVSWNDIFKYNKALLQSHAIPKERMCSELKIKQEGVLNYCKKNRVNFRYKIVTFKQIFKRFLKLF